MNEEYFLKDSTPMFKKVSITPKANYHPVSAISNFSNMSIAICYIQQITSCQVTELGCISTSVLSKLLNACLSDASL